MTLKGLRTLEKKLHRIPDATNRGVANAAYFIYRKSQPKVPVDTGRLKKSGKVTKLGNGVYEVSYHAENPKTGYNYAPIQHEHLGFKHKVGQAKYLEEPVRENMETIKRLVLKGSIK